MRLAHYFILALAVAQLSCSRKPQDLIVAQWTRIILEQQQPGFFYPTSVQFFKEGTVTVGGKELGRVVAGNYRFLDDNTLRMDIQGFAGVVLKVRVSADELLLMFPAGETARYRKGDVTPGAQSEQVEKPQHIRLSNSDSVFVGTYVCKRQMHGYEQSRLTLSSDGTYKLNGGYTSLWDATGTWKVEGKVVWLVQTQPPNVPLEVRGDTLDFPLDNNALFIKTNQ